MAPSFSRCGRESRDEANSSSSMKSKNQAASPPCVCLFQANNIYAKKSILGSLPINNGKPMVCEIFFLERERILPSFDVTQKRQFQSTRDKCRYQYITGGGGYLGHFCRWPPSNTHTDQLHFVTFGILVLFCSRV